MGRAKNTLSAQDVSSTPIKVKYFASYPSNSLQDYGITVRSGSNIPYTASMPSYQLEDMNNYRVIKQLYYQYYLTGSILNQSTIFDPVWQSTAAYGSGDSMVYSFPTGSYENIVVFTIPSSQFGEQISRNSFSISASDSSYFIKDDGNGNLIDTMALNINVGNIFYAQGIVVITNQDYTMPANYLATQIYNVYETENDIDVTLE
jgi:hypothetical protein